MTRGGRPKNSQLPNTRGEWAYRQRMLGRNWKDITAELFASRPNHSGGHHAAWMLAKYYAETRGLTFPLKVRQPPADHKLGEKIYQQACAGRRWPELGIEFCSRYADPPSAASKSAHRFAVFEGLPWPIQGISRERLRSDLAIRAADLKRSGMTWTEVGLEVFGVADIDHRLKHPDAAASHLVKSHNA